MIIIHKQKKAIELKQNIQLSITTYKKNPTISKNNLDLKDEFIGEVYYNKFWDQKTTPKFFRGPSRAFYGKFVEMDEHTNIIGSFKFLRIHKIAMFVWHILVSSLLIYQLINSILTTKQFIIVFIIVNVFFEILFHLNILFFRKEEKSVISFLESL